MRMLRKFFTLTLVLATTLAAWAQQAVPAAEADAATNAAAQQQATNTAVAAAIATKQVPPADTDFLEHLVDSILGLFDIHTGENTITHFVIAGLFVVFGILLRRVVTNVIFNQLKKLASKTETTLDDKLFPALEGPVATFVMLMGIFSALKVLKFSPETDLYITNGSKVAFSIVLFWGLLRGFSAILDHAHEVARTKNLGVAAFMPWIKKTLVAVFVVIGALITIQNLGYGESVKTLLAGLGIGGLAFALAAQDTIANLFGSIVVAIDQPFKIGEAVKIGANEGVVEDIGLRSTKLRTPGRNLIIIPNKSVASEPIVNNSRFIGRRVEQVIGLTYDTSAEQMEAIVQKIRAIIESEKSVDVSSVHVYFRDYNASSLDLWLAYNITDPDFAKHMALRQRINLAIMRAVQAAGLDFAYPTQTLHLATMPTASQTGTSGSQPAKA